MAQTLDNLAGSDGPSTGRVLNLLQSMKEVIVRFAPAQEAGGEEAVAEAGGAAGDGAPAGGGARAAGPAPRSREDYLKLLIEIADYFRRTEPHSPLSYTLEDAVRRARMSLPDLMAELVPDSNTRWQILSTLGIKPPDNQY
jgi:type VI secretion system protein ImpA